jgi:hypothetical protein
MLMILQCWSIQGEGGNSDQNLEIRLFSAPRSSNHSFSLSMANQLGKVPETPGSTILEPLACAVVPKDARLLSPLEDTALEW